MRILSGIFKSRDKPQNATAVHTDSIDMMGAVLYRTKTLAKGDDCCDFHVVKKTSKNG